MADKVTTIQLKKNVLQELKAAKKFQNQSYSDLIHELVSAIKKSKKKSDYDQFLFKVQQEKMKELWDNKYDEAWENV